MEHVIDPPRKISRLGCALAGVAFAMFPTSGCERGGEARIEDTAVPGAAEACELFAGIPQHGSELGDPGAPVTLLEFADLQCPYCREFALGVLPAIVERYVRPGKVRLVFENLAFLGPESVAAARLAAALGEEDHLFQFVDLFFRNQPPESSGVVTDAFLHRLAASLPGVDAAQAMTARSSSEVDQQLAEADAEARRFGVQGTPSLLIGKTGEPPRPIEVRSTDDPAAYEKAIDALLAQH